MINADDPIHQQIEAYLNQEMSDLDRSRFEKLIHDDPELHEEVELQESLMEAIRSERMLALKAGLNSVHISLWSTGLMEVAKIAALVTGLSVTGLVGYELIMDRTSEQEKTKTEINQSQAQVPSTQNQEISPEALEQKEVNQVPLFQSRPQHSESPARENGHPSLALPAKQPSGQSGLKTSSGKDEVRPEGISNPTPSETAHVELSEPTVNPAQGLSTKDITLPTDGITNKSSLESVHPEVVIKRDNKDRFHYQFSDNKLVLYADFSNKLYEVLELNQDNTKRIFFAYDAKFYQLNPNQLEIAPLKEVQDNNLIQILKAYQKRKN